MALGVLCILVHENSWIPKKDKHRFYLTYGIIALSALAEWLGVQFSGNKDIPVWLLIAVKCCDYILTPMAGGAVVAQMKLRNRWYKALMIVLVCNAVFQIIGCFNGWMVVVDDQHRYSHGPLYGVYVAIYLIVIVLTAIEFLLFSLSYRKQNRTSLISVFVLLLIGIGLQEILGSEYRTAYVAMTIGVALMFIHYAEFYKMEADEQLKKQRNQLMKDVLSGVFSRYAFTKDIERYSQMTALPDDFTVFVFDINGLKTVNDTLGHDAGDELIIGAARCIERVVSDAGRCYRTGGDEFVVMTHMSREEAQEFLDRLEEETKRWSEAQAALTLSIAPGYVRAEDHHDYTVEELVKKADQAMYAAKAAYYLNRG
jgi:diguanylate cyclase (GGDEF)-like protein